MSLWKWLVFGAVCGTVNAALGYPVSDWTFASFMAGIVAARLWDVLKVIAREKAEQEPGH